MPGLVGATATMEGVFWRYVYCGYFDRMAPTAQTAGRASIDDVWRGHRGRGKLGDSSAPLAGWALDRFYFSTGRVTGPTRSRLDDAADGVLHASAHIMNVNTKAWSSPTCCVPASITGLPLLGRLPTREMKAPTR